MGFNSGFKGLMVESRSRSHLFLEYQAEIYLYRNPTGTGNQE